MSDASEYSAMRSAALLIDRSDRARVRFKGPRAAGVLTGLVTSDVQSLSAGQGQYSAALSPKGKIVADLRIYVDAEGVLTDTSQRAAPGWREMVGKYVNPRLVSYSDVTPELQHLGVYGVRARRAISAALGADAAVLEQLAPYANVSVEIGERRITVARNAELDFDGYEIFTPADVTRHVRDRLLAASVIPGNARTLDIARIEAGMPEWGIDMNEDTLAQEANLDELGAISFTKGCYIGQEVVARIHFRGHVNRFLRRLHFVSASVPPTHAELFDGSGNGVGDVRSVAISPRYGGIALAMVRREVAPGTTLLARWPAGECMMQIAGKEKGATG